MFTKTTLSTFAVLALTAAATTQTYKWETSPTGYKNTHGNGACSIFGAYQLGRMQFANRGLTGKSRKTIDRIYFRHDNRNLYYAWQGGGRSWAKVKLYVGETYTQRMKNTWDNYSTRATLVHDAKWSMPTKTGSGMNSSWTIRMSFSKPWVYTASRDTLMDFMFYSGKLTNGRSWGSSAHSYYLDGVTQTTNPTHNEALVTRLPWAGLCRDSAITKWLSSTGFRAFGSVYSDNHSVTTLRGKLSMTRLSQYTAPRAPVVFMTSLAGYTKGIDIGAKCNKLWLNPAAAIDYTIRMTSSYGGAGITKKLTFQNSWAGRYVWYQAGWTDSKTGQLGLTPAVKVLLPKKPVNVFVPARAAVVHPNKLARTGYGPYTSARYQPLILFRYK